MPPCITNTVLCKTMTMKKIDTTNNEAREAHVMQAARTLRRMNEEFPSDVLGSYTGTDTDDERPVQDVDDL